MKILLPLVLFLSIPSLVQADEITFIASRSELRQALRNKQNIQGLAISGSFYKNSTLEIQNEIDR